MDSQYKIGGLVRIGRYNQIETITKVNKVFFTTSSGNKYTVNKGKLFGSSIHCQEYAYPTTQAEIDENLRNDRESKLFKLKNRLIGFMRDNPEFQEYGIKNVIDNIDLQIKYLQQPIAQ